MQENKTTEVNQDNIAKTPNVATIITEGGSAVQSTPIILPNKTLKISLEAEIAKDKSIEESSSSRVKARKGAVLEANSTATENKHLKEVNTNQDVKEGTQFSSLPHNTTESSVSTQSSNTSRINEKSTTQVVTTTTVKPTKPPILHSEALDKMTKQNMKNNMFVKSSDENGSAIKMTPMSSSQHPGMVMPIVITILVVPMFAVLGYMAMKRGQEAWRNRHYKRMDFLLDGMYNE
ncbi:hypothetical protein O0L34_g8995 [Tuta absoluta]|nr:hypothetical protein O0L34_g8995 [Tuta absoluta]